MPQRFSPFDVTLRFATAEAAPPTHSLEEETQTDVCVVGAGHTGMREVPFCMRFGPQLSQRWHRIADNLTARRARAALPPHT